MKTVGKEELYEFEITEVRRYTVQGSGHGAFEAEQDAIERYHRLAKSGDLIAHTVGKPKVISTTLVK